jgi:hypothetical protein
LDRFFGLISHHVNHIDSVTVRALSSEPLLFCIQPDMGRNFHLYNSTYVTGAFRAVARTTAKRETVGLGFATIPPTTLEQPGIGFSARRRVSKCKKTERSKL